MFQVAPRRGRLRRTIFPPEHPVSKLFCPFQTLFLWKLLRGKVGAAMASGGYRPPGNTTDFLEEWKAKREKMRARFAAATGSNNAADPGPAPTPVPAPAPAGELNHGGGGVRAPAPVPRRGDEEGRSDGAARTSAADGVEAEPPPATPSPAASPAPCPKNKEKKSSGPSARKGKGQIEKRKLREKRRSTGVVNIPSTEGTSRTTSRWKSSGGGPEEEVTTYSTNSRFSGRGERLGYSRYGNSTSSTYGNVFEKKQEEFEKELAKERQENQKLVKLLQDRDELIGKLKEEIDLLNRDLDEIEDENDQLKQENKTLLKVVGQLTR
ncbi:PRKC apoptosis WT1 regulator protein isoform X2 [Narcine bancroftii]|uniref:PRKC apoptosis WT1 regulator protein isoform X2 n=1 Tax=Narcine bancroftii TaxID=1343680 RepID=UPI00383192F2